MKKDAASRKVAEKKSSVIALAHWRATTLARATELELVGLPTAAKRLRGLAKTIR